MKFRPGTDQGDYDIKLRNLVRFLEHGDKAKVTLRFRGREMAYKDLGMNKFKGIIEQIEEFGAICESELKFMGNRIITILAPDKKTKKKPNGTRGKSKPKAEAKAKQESNVKIDKSLQAVS